MTDTTRKQTPIAKVYEALSAIADNRITMRDTDALITSSNYSKCYTVRISDDLYSSNDNATYWQHYAGYPIVAVLIKQGKLVLPNHSKELLAAFKDINWKKLNLAHKNNYDQAVSDFLNRSAQPDQIKQLVQVIFDQLNQLPFSVKGNRAKLIKLVKEDSSK
ncbi:MAG: hypothetical protein ABF908_04185 [Lentilactobacillus diolivorans]